MHYVIKGVCFDTPPLNKFLNIDANKWWILELTYSLKNGNLLFLNGGWKTSTVISILLSCFSQATYPTRWSFYFVHQTAMAIKVDESQYYSVCHGLSKKSECDISYLMRHSHSYSSLIPCVMVLVRKVNVVSHIMRHSNLTLKMWQLDHYLTRYPSSLTLNLNYIIAYII
jgi:hypothetical protein